jgi:hypothetical protein
MYLQLGVVWKVKVCYDRLTYGLTHDAVVRPVRPLWLGRGGARRSISPRVFPLIRLCSLLDGRKAD